MPDHLTITNATIACMDALEDGYGLRREAALRVQGERIDWVGPMAEVGEVPQDAQVIDAGGRLLTPGLIDCHTHIVHGGNRAREFEMRLEGASYEEVARAGGGIVSTVKATREADESLLLAQALRRADALISEGVTTIEIKSGYGLDIETELKMLRVARAVGEARPVRVVTSFWVRTRCPRARMQTAISTRSACPRWRRPMPRVWSMPWTGFAGIAFDTAQIARVFDKAAALGLPVKLHAEQLSNIGGTKLAAERGALSADHVEYAGEADAKALAEAGSVAVLLPGAFYTLHETQKPPVAAFRTHGVPMAVATDWNPGSSPMGSVLLAMNMACTLFGLTPAEALAGTTHHAAQALGLYDRGEIAPGMRADLAIWDVEEPAELSYRIGVNSLHKRIFGGRA